MLWLIHYGIGKNSMVNLFYYSLALKKAQEHVTISSLLLFISFLHQKNTQPCCMAAFSSFSFVPIFTPLLHTTCSTCVFHFPFVSHTVAQKTASMFAYYIKTHVLLNADII